jgi:hypothetical protein
LCRHGSPPAAGDGATLAMLHEFGRVLSTRYTEEGPKSRRKSRNLWSAGWPPKIEFQRSTGSVENSVGKPSHARGIKAWKKLHLRQIEPAAAFPVLSANKGIKSKIPKVAQFFAGWRSSPSGNFRLLRVFHNSIG